MAISSFCLQKYKYIQKVEQQQLLILATTFVGALGWTADVWCHLPPELRKRQYFVFVFVIVFYDMTPIAERVCVCVHYFSRFCLLSAMLMMLSRVVNCIINVCWGRRHIKTKLLICNKSWQVVKLLTYIYNCINTKVHKRKSVCGTKPKDTKEDSYVYLGV